MRLRRRETAPRPIASCPTWCTRDHALDLAEEDGFLLHCRDVGSGVEVVVVDDFVAGDRTPAAVCVEATSCESPEGARRLALAILEAADHLDGAR